MTLTRRRTVHVPLQIFNQRCWNTDLDKCSTLNPVDTIQPACFLFKLEVLKLFTVSVCLPHPGWRPGRCGCHRCSPGRPQQTLSLRSRWRATHRRAWRCGTRRWLSRPRGCDCWHSYGLSGPASGFSSMEWSHRCRRWRAWRSPDIKMNNVRQ